MGKITHQITLREKPGRHMLERQSRYDVLLSGQPVSELYYNMRGYRGALPTVRGGWMDIGERGISAWRKEVAWQNKNARDILAKSEKSTRRIRTSLPTEDPRMVFAVSVDLGKGSAKSEPHLLWRREFIHGREIFGDDLAPEFFAPMEISPRDPDAPCVLLEEKDAFIAAMFPDVSARIMEEEEVCRHRCKIIGSYVTDDPEVFLAVACENERIYSGHFVSRWIFEPVEACYGNTMRLADLEECEAVAITNEADRQEIHRLLPSLDLDGSAASKPAPDTGADTDEGISPWT